MLGADAMQVAKLMIEAAASQMSEAVEANDPSAATPDIVH
jgi:hypothetical protein